MFWIGSESPNRSPRPRERSCSPTPIRRVSPLSPGRAYPRRHSGGFLRTRGWDIPYMGRWHFIPEATLEITRHGPIAVLEVDLEAEPPDAIVAIGGLSFRSVLGTDLDARALPPSVVSESARDVLGAVATSRGR